ncbi:MAG: helicase C-terminal domain-containing protein [Candidatus Hatepunaea meridiana]|nr:helicase C-terminal domain-containing protein [Candidatus Hatepunaea meridiana]
MTKSNIQNEFWDLTELNEYVAIDIETTGLDSKKDVIIELGAVRFKEGKATDRFSEFVNPLRRLPSFITELTGINDRDLRDAHPLIDLADNFISFVGDSQIVGHHISFDLGFLEESSATTKHFHKNRTIPLTHDTNLIARFLFPCLDSYGLKHLTHLFNTFVRPKHRAVKDAEATGELFKIFLMKMSAIPFRELSNGYRFVEGTASPLANTIRSVRKALSAGFISSKKPPDALKGTVSGRTNVYSIDGDKRPEKPVEDRHIRRLFSDTERFRKVVPGYHLREEQVGMAVMTAGAFREDAILVVEAGTGVGKSLGYLVPALLSGGRVVISTFTKNLQDQLFYDEIPKLGNLFKFGFKSALLKGRRNYFCRNKWKTWLMTPERIASPFLRERAALISRWIEATNTGDISEINAIRQDQGEGFFHLIASEPGYCSGRNCSEFHNCPLMQIRQKALKADLLIVNHSLVMTDLQSEGSLLGDFGRIVFDEAHHIEDVATDQFGSDITAPVLKSVLERINRLCRRNSELWLTLTGVIGSNNLSSISEKAASDAGDLTESVSNLFDQARALFESRITKGAVYSESFRYVVGDRIFQALFQFGAPLVDGFNVLKKTLVNLRKELQEFEEDDIPAQLIQELQGGIDQVSEQLSSLQYSLTADDENRVYWVEIPPDINRAVRLKSAPLDVSNYLTDTLWKRLNSAVLTSATLATTAETGGFEHLFLRLGLNLLDEERLRAEKFGSPFDFQKNCIVCYPSYIASPSEDYRAHTQDVAKICSDLALTHRRNMLILFTSYKAMRAVEWELKTAVSGSGIEILVQGKPGGNERLVNRFRRTKRAVLLGTYSLWEGIDVPGKALQIVVIPRLPFDVPNDPVVAARIDHIRNIGGNPFYEFQMPSAILRLRQGTGRLIRLTSDRGLVLVLDPRTVTKGYGSRFRQTIPGRIIIPKSEEQLNENIAQFFDVGR